jgi:hypothetical protein
MANNRELPVMAKPLLKAIARAGGMRALARQIGRISLAGDSALEERASAACT